MLAMLALAGSTAFPPSVCSCIGALVSPTHQGLVRDMLVKLEKYMGAPLVEERIGLLENFIIVDDHGIILVCPKVSSTPVAAFLIF